MAFPNYDEITTTTLRNRSKKLADNVSRNNALLHRLSEKGNKKPVDGGRTIFQELEYAQNQTAMWFSGFQALNINPSQVFTAAEFNLRQAAVAIAISGLERLQNSGEEQAIDLLESRIKNAERTLENLVASATYSDGSNSLLPGGLKFLVADTPTAGTVGGISRATWQFWQNIVFGAAANGGVSGGALTSGIGGGPFTPQNIQNFMNQLYVQLLRGRDKPDLIIADNNTYIAYMESLQNIQRITTTKMATAGFTSLAYMDCDVVLDGGFQGYAGDINPAAAGCPPNHMYFLNTEYIFYRPHKRCDMVPLNPGERFSTNQDAMVKLLGWAGNMTISNSRMQGVLTP